MNDGMESQVWEVVQEQGKTLDGLVEAQVRLAQVREADKQVIEQLGATVELQDARIAMLSAKLDELEARLGTEGS
jgi:hypothetical protein